MHKKDKKLHKEEKRPDKHREEKAYEKPKGKHAGVKKSMRGC